MKRHPILVAGLMALMLAACGSDDAAGAKGGRGGDRPPSLVSAVSATSQEFAPRLVALGTVAPLQTVDIRTRAEGEITAILFNEGDNVRAGQLLFRLDDRQAQAQLESARAQLATARANSAQAASELKRAEALVDKGFITGSVLDQRRALSQGAQASISSAQAAVRNAEAALTFLNIRAPVSGRTGELNFRLGANVRPADLLPLVTINQLSPISVRFLVPPQDIAQVRAAMMAGPVPVDARVQGAGGLQPPLARGVLAFLDNNVDPGNGSVIAKAEFRNPDAALWPGAIVNVAMPMGTPSAQIALPESAVQTGQDKPFVWLIAADGSVSMRNVAVKGRADGTAYLASGLQQGERVVTDALARLKAGDKVRTRGGPDGAAQPRTAAADRPAVAG
ncbi:RND transporter [Polymorphobacter multimanifer]|uniref:Multidrug efflux system membrane fusion protein n=1 Tax=Polymorphobacter multimanifer TaxID=1070431 RepID=A0A841LIG8_9SPHN|nr:efflux RND transporter periplasmic adaptor subunit [Polymorphobacter multimanifer]MBB6229012.1 multidrug efflux system membrane fusion protein [Polymorphobacter multimanifer]GGI78397.1 RND transporter [Polymorphobacter multimanifer]